LNHDGLHDLLVGEYEGYVYFLENTGTILSPIFDSVERMLLQNADPLQYSNSHPRSRLYVTD